LAISAEKATEELYRRLEAKFAHHQEVADFWGKYAAEEARHAQWLERLRDRSSPEQLSAPADPLMLKDARKILQFSIEDALEKIENLEDAYQLMTELENSETNAIFEFLIANFSSDERTLSFLRSQLEDHLARLTEFPTQFRGTARRQVIKALE
jgi:rubrerythrin